MVNKLTSTLVNPLQMGDEPRRAFAREICALISEIFVVKDEARLFNNFAAPTNDEIKIKVFRNEQGKMVGFVKYTIDFGEHQGRKQAAFNSHAGFLRAYRGRSSTVLYAIRAMLAFKLRHPTWDIFYFGILIHPSSYSLFAKFGVEYWPRYDRHTPPEQEKRMIDMARQFAGDESVYNPEYPLVRMYYLNTQTLAQEQEYWKSSEKPTVQYFLKINPRYAEGAGVFTWLSIDQLFLRSILATFMKESVKKRGRKMKAQAYRNPFIKNLLPKPDVAKILANVPILDSMEDEDLHVLIQSAQVVSVPSGKYIIRTGDLGDSMYVVVQGSVYVLIPGNEGETIVDQLGAGDYFGEMALMSGEPRSASIRTISSTILVRIDRESFHQFLQAKPELEENAWDVFGQRRFNTFLFDQDRFKHLDHKACLKWYNSAERKRLGLGAETRIPASQYAFLIAGDAEIKSGANWLSVKAPAMLQFAEDYTLKALTEIHIGLLNNTVNGGR